jgi:hypothetical protein
MLRRLVLSRDEQELLADAPRAVFRARLLRKLLRWDQLALVDALDDPDRWMPDEPLTQAEAEAWGAALLSPVGRKIDIAMSNLGQQEAQRACHTPTAETIRQTGYAAGFRAAWLLAKSLSTMAGAQPGKSEEGTTTGDATLDHLNP